MENMTIGQRIASRRKLANLSQERISEELGVSRQAVSKWESDAGIPDVDNLVALSKLFGVSVGWLLGTEKDPSFDPSTGLSESQLKMVEEIIAGSRPKGNRVFAAVILAMLLLFGVFFHNQISHLSRENRDAQNQISALEAGNQELLAQVEQVRTALDQQEQEEALLLNVHTEAYLSEDMQTVSLSFYLIPKLFQETAQAYVTVRNQENAVYETLECVPMGKWYFCKAELPVYNGYQYAFVLATESGFQEQSLSDVAFVHYFQNLLDATRYHLDPTAPKRTVWNSCDREYVFALPICSPLIDFQTAYVGYEEVCVLLYLNGEPVYEASVKEAFRAYGGAYMRFEEPYTPDIRVQLPALEAGDILTLEIQAKHHNGKLLKHILENLEVVE